MMTRHDLDLTESRIVIDKEILRLSIEFTRAGKLIVQGIPE